MITGMRKGMTVLISAMDKVATILIITMKKLTSVLAKNGLFWNKFFNVVNYQDKKSKIC